MADLSNPAEEKLVIYKNGDFAYGSFNTKLKRDGFVQYQSQQGPHVVGMFEENARSGTNFIDFGELEARFQGSYKKDQKNGPGVVESEQDTLVGNFKNGLLNGYGRYSGPQGFYEGFWTDGRFDGYGVELMANSDCYIGEFKKGRKEGLGFYLFAKGGYYYGFFKANEKSEMGVLYNANYLCYYLGEFKNDERNGRGMQISEDASVYHGSYANDKRSGVGIMEYGNGAIYIGEWVNNLRQGKGRLEKDQKVLSGNFKQNNFIMACAVDLDEVLKPFYQKDHPKNMEVYLRKKGYVPCDVQMPNLELSELLKVNLLDLMRDKCYVGEIKGHIFRKLRYLLQDKVSLRDLSIQIHRAFSVPPNNSEILQIFKALIPLKIETGEVPVRWHGLNFNDKKQPEFILSHMVVTNDCVLGSGIEEVSGQKYTIDGICGPNGTMYIFLKIRSQIRTFHCVAGPNYLSGVDSNENKFFLIPETNMYKGFYVRDDPRDKKTIRYFMKVGEKYIYGFGRDDIGIYMISGESSAVGDSADGSKRQLKFKVCYAAGYTITMKGVMDKTDEIVGRSVYAERRVGEWISERKVHA